MSTTKPFLVQPASPTKVSKSKTPRIKYFSKIYACQPSYQAAKELAESNPRRFGQVICVEETKFADGNHNLTIPYPNSDGTNVIYICSYYHNDDNKLTDNRVIQFLMKRGGRTLTVVIPFFGSATNERAERGFRNGVPFETIAIADTDSKTLGFFTNKNTRLRVILYDLHTLVQPSYFPTSISVIMESAIPYAVEHELPEFDCVVYPDAGSRARFSEYFLNTTATYFYKERIVATDERVLRCADPDVVKNRRCLIVDDLVRTGGTIGQCAEKCKELGAASLIVYIPHAVFPEPAHLSQFAKNGRYAKFIDAFYVTSSLPDVEEKLAGHEIKIIKFSDILAKSVHL